MSNWIRGVELKSKEEIFLDLDQVSMIKVDHDKHTIGYVCEGKTILLNEWSPVRHWQRDLGRIQTIWRQRQEQERADLETPLNETRAEMAAMR